MSGTMVQAIIAYITDYITKSTLKTYAVFEAVLAVLDGCSSVMAESLSREIAVRCLLTKIVNALTSRKQVGGPMVCHKLAGYPDHYSSIFPRTVFWYSYIRQVAEDTGYSLESSVDTDNRNTVMLAKAEGKVVGSRKVDDYRYQHQSLRAVSLYEFLTKTWVKKKEIKDAKKIQRWKTKVKRRRGKKLVQTIQQHNLIIPLEMPREKKVWYTTLENLLSIAMLLCHFNRNIPYMVLTPPIESKTVLRLYPLW